MRIAVWYESGLGRNDGNPLYVLSFLKRVQHFCDVFEKRNQNEKLVHYFPNGVLQDPLAESVAKTFFEKGERLEAEHLRPNGKHIESYGKFDYHIWIDWGEDGLKGILPYDPIFPEDAPLIYWASDTHLGYDYRLNVARRSQLVFCAQKDAVERMKQDAGVEAEWLPHAFEPLAYPRFNFASKKYDVCFVGHVNNGIRLDYLDRLFREFPNFFWGQRRFEQASEIYNRTKVVFNKAMIDDLNMRVFEVLGSGSFLLTDRISTIEELFTDGKHLVCYDNFDDMVNKCRYYIENEKERLEIAEQGYLHAKNNHTIAHRVIKMLQGIEKKELAHV